MYLLGTHALWVKKTLIALSHRPNHLTSAQISEENGIVQAAQKDLRRFEPLYKRYHRTIFLFVFKRVTDEETAADLTAQVFLKAMQNLGSYTFRGLPFSAWLYRIAINEVNQLYRREKQARVVSIETTQLGELFEELDGRKDDDGVAKLVKTLERLKPEELEWIELRFFEKTPFKEIAELYGITENNAKVKMYRLLGKMKKWMEEVQA